MFFGGDDVFGLEELDFEIEIDFIFFEDELFEELLFEDVLWVLLALLLLPEMTLVIFPRVVRVFLDLVVVDVLGIFLISVLFVFSGLIVFTLRKASDSATFGEALLSLRAFNLIFPLLACLLTG